MKRNLTTPEALREAVAERVAAGFPAALFFALTEQHKRHGFKSSCPCTYCNTKREVTHWRGYSSHLESYWTDYGGGITPIQLQRPYRVETIYPRYAAFQDRVNHVREKAREKLKQAEEVL